MSKIKIPYKLGKSIDKVGEEKGEEFLYRIEWLISHYKNTLSFSAEVHESINTIVEYIKKSDEHRKNYFGALVNGYEKEEPINFCDYAIEDKQNILDIIIKDIESFAYSPTTYNLSYEKINGTETIDLGSIGTKMWNGTTSLIVHFNGGARDTYQ